MKTKLLFTICLGFSALVFGQVPANGLTGFYPFSGNANDCSGNANDPTYIGSGITLTTDRFGDENCAYYFDGNPDSYMRIPADNFPATDRTISLWFKIPEVTNRPALLSYGGDGNCGTTFFMGINVSGYDQYTVQGHCTYNELTYPYPAAPVNEWYHWVVTVSGATQKIYINGEFKASAETFTGSTYVTGRDLSFGVLTYVNGYAPYTDQNCGYLKGALDDIRIYDHALTDAEILSLYSDISTGIMHHPKEEFPRVLNNPSEGNFTVDLGLQNSHSKITVSDLFSRIVYSKRRVDERIINLRINEPAGIYIMNIDTGETRSIHRLVIQK